jgi:hypothetical protein
LGKQKIVHTTQACTTRIQKSNRQTPKRIS